MRRRAIIAVVGGGQRQVPPGSLTYEHAKTVGTLIAERGGILLCGGGSGVMEAAALGASRRARMTIGIMKESHGESAGGALGQRIWTGLGDGRNYVNAAASDVMIACAGETGTLSEIALALKLRKRVMCLQAWEFLARAGFEVAYVATPEEAVSGAFSAIGADPRGFVEGPITYPCLPDQTAHCREFAAVVEAWSRS